MKGCIGPNTIKAYSEAMVIKTVYQCQWNNTIKKLSRKSCVYYYGRICESITGFETTGYSIRKR